jgi:hypothetical protein
MTTEPLTSQAARSERLGRIRARGGALMEDRVSVALAVVFVLASVLYYWRATYVEPLSFHGSQTGAYNRLADAFLHFHLWIRHFSAATLGPEPSNPAVRPAFLIANYGDYVLYKGYLYLTWGPAPVLTLLVPLHLLGYEPSGSVIITPYAIIGLAAALATLRVILRQVGRVKLWMCILAATTLATASLVPFLLQFATAEVYDQAIAAAYCFTMIGVWLSMSAIAERRGSLRRIGLASLCFGLAAASRPDLGVIAVLLIPVYLSLRTVKPRRGLLIALVVPVGACFLLLVAYNQARYGDPLEVGSKFQINGGDYHARWAELSYLPPGLWAYLVVPPRLSVLFPFIGIPYPWVSEPFTIPPKYGFEPTAGLLPMAPIVFFLAGLPILSRRPSARLGRLGLPLMMMAACAVTILLFLSYEFFGTTERYQVDYDTLFLFGALAVWLVLASEGPGLWRRLVRWGGGLLVVWSCIAGAAMSLQEFHPNTQRHLVDLASPVSAVIARAVGRPILAQVFTRHVLSLTGESYGRLDSEVTSFWMAEGEPVALTIVSPGSGEDFIAGKLLLPSSAPEAGTRLEAHVEGPGHRRYSYGLPAGGHNVRIPVHLTAGVNHVVLSATSAVHSGRQASPTPAEGEALMGLAEVHLAGS